MEKLELYQYECCKKHRITKFLGCPECALDKSEQQLSNIKSKLTKLNKKLEVYERTEHHIHEKLDMLIELIKLNNNK